ncbi:MAG: hypothetical protein LW701_04860 [Fluviicola sp.]|jgi:hypothetical protein|nr:hypothetical protein [Fluviicola sp.]
MFKKSLFVGVTAGILSGVASIIFTGVYKEITFVDFSPVVNAGSLIGACMFGCVLASIGFWGLIKVTPKYGEIIFNFLFTILTFASILGPIGYKFPLDFNEEITMYFPFLAITLHFFPALIWFAVKPIFIK